MAFHDLLFAAQVPVSIDAAYRAPAQPRTALGEAACANGPAGLRFRAMIARLRAMIAGLAGDLRHKIGSRP